MFVLPAPAAGQAASVVVASLSTCHDKHMEPIGPFYHAHWHRVHRNRTFSEEDREQARLDALKHKAEEDAYDSEEESAKLLESDPREWKSQDHYAVMGLSKLRYKATLDDIQRAYRKKVLRHHPDKKAAASGGFTNDDRFFKCIQKANEILMDPVKRRQWDSADPGVKNDPPKAGQKVDDFFGTYGKLFDVEARFWKGPDATRKFIPSIGDLDTPKEAVEDFYDFWYNFDSWRSFEYLDKEDLDMADNRDNKRYMEKKNKSERARRKKEDNARLRELIDQALGKDPRIALFKQKEKEAKEQKRLAREQAERDAKEAKLRALQKDKPAPAPAKTVAVAVEKTAANTKDKEAKKKAAKKEKKTMKDLVKDNGYFCTGTVTPDWIDAQLTKLDRVFEKHGDDLEAVRVQLQEAISKGKEEALAVLDAKSA